MSPRPFQPRHRSLTVVLPLAAAVALLLVVTPAAPAAGPPPIPTDSPDRPTPVPAELRGKLGKMPSSGAKLVNGTARDRADRKGLGLPSYRQLIGSGWKRRVAKADRRFAKKLDASESAPAGNGRPAGPRAGAAVGRDAVGEFDRMFRVADALRGKRGKQTRKLKVQATLDGGCPYLNSLGTAYGWRGSGRATYEVTTTERAGRYNLVTAVVLDGSFRARPSMLNRAVADDFHSADYGEIAITRNQVAINRRTGKRHRVGETERFTSKLRPDYRPEGSFEAFIASQNDGSRGKPAPRRPLRSAVWEEMAAHFMAIPYLAMRSRVLEAEQLARTPNRCVSLSVAAPSHLAPGAKLELTGVPKLLADPGLNPFKILEHSDRVTAYWINPQGQQARPLNTPIHKLWNGKPWYEFTAPPAAWPDSRPAGLELELHSGAGIASADVTFKAEAPALYFEVLDASIETHTDASTPHPACGEVGGTRSFGGGHHRTEFDPQNRVELGPGGQATGKISGLIDARWYDQTVYGCKIDPEGGSLPCEETMPDETPGEDGTWDVWVSFRPAADPGQVKLVWSMHDPDVGYFDAGDEQCYAYVAGQLEEETATQTIARSQLQSGKPIELSLAGTVHLDEHGGFWPASIDHTYDYRMRIQRVAADGSPISPS